MGSIDAQLVDGKYVCFSHSGTRMTKSEPVTLARELQNRGVGEILITSLDKDGTMKGYDIELVKKISENVNIPVIASGGVGKLDHLYEGLKIGNANAVLAASIFHFGEFSIEDAKKYLDSKGISVRI